MKEDLSYYPEKFIYRIAKSLKAEGFDFEPYYEAAFKDNIEIVEEVSSLYGIDIPEDFFVELYKLNGGVEMFEDGFNINNLRYPTLERYFVTIGVSHDVVITREYKVPTKTFYSKLRLEKYWEFLIEDQLYGDLIRDERGNPKFIGEPKVSRSDEDFNETYLSSVNEIGINESVQKRKTKLESLNRDQLLRLKGLIDEQLRK
jgi:hypothetical protein